MATTSSGKLLAIAVVGSLVMMIALSLLAQRGIEIRPTPQQPLSPELREARTVEEEQSYMQLLNNITSATTTTPAPASPQTRRSR